MVYAVRVEAGRHLNPVVGRPPVAVARGRFVIPGPCAGRPPTADGYRAQGNRRRAGWPGQLVGRRAVRRTCFFRSGRTLPTPGLTIERGAGLAPPSGALRAEDCDQRPSAGEQAGEVTANDDGDPSDRRSHRWASRRIAGHKCALAGGGARGHGEGPGLRFRRLLSTERSALLLGLQAPYGESSVDSDR